MDAMDLEIGEDEMYWVPNNFWPKFLQEDKFDHVHMIDAFKTVVGETYYRKLILEKYIDKDSFVCNFDKITMQADIVLNDIRLAWNRAKIKKKIAYLTWEYPAITDDAGDTFSHFVMLIANPFTKEVHHIDTRGLSYIGTVSDSWCQKYKKLKELFHGCKWHDVVVEDLQLLNTNDNFCQTWSLIATLMPDRNEDRIKNVMKEGYDAILHFWKEILTIHEVKEAIYYEIYRKTHNRADGVRHYHRYFSRLEEHVTQSEHVYYPTHHAYIQTGYSFLEDFVASMDNALMQRILA